MLRIIGIAISIAVPVITHVVIRDEAKKKAKRIIKDYDAKVELTNLECKRLELAKGILA